jgi:hypothetical protein
MFMPTTMVRRTVLLAFTAMLALAAQRASARRHGDRRGERRAHSGYFPGYLTEMRYFTSLRVAVVIMANSSAPGAFPRGRGPARLANEVGALVAAWEGRR